MSPSNELTFLRGSDLVVPILPAHYSKSSRATPLPLTVFEVREALEMALPQAGFRGADLARNMNYAAAGFESEPRGGRLNLKTRRAIEVAWREDARLAGQTFVEWVVYDDRTKPLQFDERLTSQFGEALVHAAKAVAAARGHLPGLLGPGERIEERDAARIATAPDRVRDYSGCARWEDVSTFRSGLLSVGRYLHFGRTTPHAHPGVELYLDDARVVTVVGRAAAGKTALLRRWAIDAHWRGFNVLFVSSRAQAPAGWIDADVTRVDILPGGPVTSASSALIRQLAAALIPGDDATIRQDREWLAAFVHLVQLQAERAGKGRACLHDLVRFLIDEDTAIDLIESTRAAEDGEAVVQPSRSARLWSAKLHALISPRWEHGKRDPAMPYEAVTSRMLHAIEPFLPSDGAVAGALDDLLGARRTGILLRLPTDVHTAGIVVPVVQMRIEQIMSLKGQGQRSLLVAIDDVDRIARVDTARLITAARNGDVACLLSAEGGPLIDLQDKAGAQVWLMPLDEPAATALNRRLGPRARQTVTVEVTARQSRSARVSWQENAPFFHDGDLRQAPGGRAPAVVVPRWTGKPSKPIVTELDPDALTWIVDAQGGGHFRTIGEALREVPPHARLAVRPGVYREDIKVVQPVSIEGLGAREEVVIAPPEWYCVTTHAPELRLSCLTLQTGSAYALRVQAGHVVAIDCRMTSRVEIGAGCSGELYGCTIDRGSVDAYPGSTIVAQDCLMSSSDAAEALSLADAHARIRHSVLEASRKCALLVDGGDVLLEDCEMRRVRYGVIGWGGRPVLRRCLIRDVSEAAVLNQPGCEVQLDASVAEGPILNGLP